MPKKEKSQSENVKLFIEKAYSSVGNMHEAMNTLSANNSELLRRQGHKWGIDLSKEDIAFLLEAFTTAQGKPIGDDAVRGC